MDGLLDLKGIEEVKELSEPEKKLAIILAKCDTHFKVESQNKETGSFFGIIPNGVCRGVEQFDYYFNCSGDYLEVEYVHIYDYGEGIEEQVLELDDTTKLKIIGKCMLFVEEQKMEKPESFVCTKDCENCDAFEFTMTQKALKSENGKFIGRKNDMNYTCQFLETNVDFETERAIFNYDFAAKLYEKGEIK